MQRVLAAWLECNSRDTVSAAGLLGNQGEARGLLVPGFHCLLPQTDVRTGMPGLEAKQQSFNGSHEDSTIIATNCGNTNNSCSSGFASFNSCSNSSSGNSSGSSSSISSSSSSGHVDVNGRVMYLSWAEGSGKTVFVAHTARHYRARQRLVSCVFFSKSDRRFAQSGMAHRGMAHSGDSRGGYHIFRNQLTSISLLLYLHSFFRHSSILTHPRVLYEPYPNTSLFYSPLTQPPLPTQY